MFPIEFISGACEGKKREKVSWMLLPKQSHKTKKIYMHGVYSFWAQIEEDRYVLLVSNSTKLDIHVISWKWSLTKKMNSNATATLYTSHKIPRKFSTATPRCSRVLGSAMEFGFCGDTTDMPLRPFRSTELNLFQVHPICLGKRSWNERLCLLNDNISVDHFTGTTASWGLLQTILLNMIPRNGAPGTSRHIIPQHCRQQQNGKIINNYPLNWKFREANILCA